MTYTEVPVPEQASLSIMATIAPRVADGLHALVQKTLAEVSTSKPEHPGRAGDVITNTYSGTGHGTVIQIGKVRGNVNDDQGR